MSQHLQAGHFGLVQCLTKSPIQSSLIYLTSCACAQCKKGKLALQFAWFSLLSLVSVLALPGHELTKFRNAYNLTQHVVIIPKESLMCLYIVITRLIL